MMIVAGATLICMIMYRLVNTWYLVDKIHVEGRVKRAYYKVCLFGIAVLGVWSAVFIGRMTVANDKAAVDSFEDWAVCQVISYSNNASYTECGEHAAIRVSRSAIIAQYFAQTIHGVVLFALFCHDRELYTCWIETFIFPLVKKVEEWRKKVETSEKVVPVVVPAPQQSDSLPPSLSSSLDCVLPTPE